MKDVIFLVSMALGIYIVARIILKEPLLPWKQKKEVTVQPKGNSKQKKGSKKGEADPLEEEPTAPFQELFPHVDEVESHMIRHKDQTFSMLAEVEPVNYFLLDQEEQEGIDATFETWLSQLNYPVRIYLQNRFVDLTSPVQEIQKVMEKEDSLHPLAFQFGQNMIRDLMLWQNEQPRYETKRYLIFDYKVDVKDIKADDKEELEEKIVEKAFNELFRRLNTAKSQLRKADMNVQMLTTDGIVEVLYYGFNRRKAKKNHYRDIAEQEQLALYTTADQSASRIARVKGEMEIVQKESKTEKREETETGTGTDRTA